MNKKVLLLVALFLLSVSAFSQENPLAKFDTFIGKWQGTGEGFGNATSVINSEFNKVLGDQFIEFKNHSEFKPTPQNQEGEIHDDWGMISFDQERGVVVLRQYHNEGFYNEYVLVDSLSTDKKLIFDTEKIENFVPGGRARLTITILSDTEIETTFDVGFPGKEMACFGKNRLHKK